MIKITKEHLDKWNACNREDGRECQLPGPKGPGLKKPHVDPTKQEGEIF